MTILKHLFVLPSPVATAVQQYQNVGKEIPHMLRKDSCVQSEQPRQSQHGSLGGQASYRGFFPKRLD